MRLKGVSGFSKSILQEAKFHNQKSHEMKELEITLQRSESTVVLHAVGR